MIFWGIFWGRWRSVEVQNKICNFSKIDFMEALILEPKTQQQLDSLKKFLSKNGIASFTISDANKKYLAGLKMTEIVDKHSKFEISDEEIIDLLKEDENGIYEK